MKTTELLAQAQTPDGTVLSLTRRDDEFVILANGKGLMSSRLYGSEQALAELGCRRARTQKKPCVLIGGLGMGFSLRAALAILPKDAQVVVAELVPAVVEWNRGPLGHLAGNPLLDERVRIEICDVAELLQKSSARFDAILLDVDNGPSAFTAPENDKLYSPRGLRAARAALRPGGTLAVWSAGEDHSFERRLAQLGFVVAVERVRARLKQGGPRHLIFLGHKPLPCNAPTPVRTLARTPVRTQSR